MSTCQTARGQKAPSCGFGQRHPACWYIHDGFVLRDDTFQLDGYKYEVSSNAQTLRLRHARRMGDRW